MTVKLIGLVAATALAGSALAAGTGVTDQPVVPAARVPSDHHS